MSEWIRSEAESTKYEDVLYRAVKPRKRDFWKVLSGTYTPQVERVERVTVAGVNKVLKEVWTSKPMQEQLYRDSPLLSSLDGQNGTVGISKRTD
jgi:hypothetical protein